MLIYPSSIGNTLREKKKKLKYIEAIEKYGEDFFIGGASSIKYISA